MKSFGFVVEMPDTDGMPFPPLHFVAVRSRLALGSKGEFKLAPLTPNSVPEAIVGAPLKLTVITSDVMVLDATPNHSV
jgi:hypothetical protein